MICAEADFWGSAVGVAVTVTVKSLEGIVGGAVYVVSWPPLVTVGEILPQEFPLQATAQVTPSWPTAAPDTSAATWTVEPACTLCGAEIVTIMGCWGWPPPHPKLPTAVAVTQTAKVPMLARRRLFDLMTDLQFCPV
ncbi:MAG TPA: hypothetical protein VF783_23570 [Terriglobales bacterium]